MYKYLFILAFLGIFAASCGEENTYQTRMEDERKDLRKYLDKHDITEKNLLSSGVYYQELYTPEDTSKNTRVEVGDDVVIYYTGYFTDGMIFDSNVLSGKYEPMTVRIAGAYTGYILSQGVTTSQVITGWPPALLEMHEGSKARVVVPSNRGYGIYGTSGIPGYTVLVFEIEVEEVRKSA